MAEQEPPRRGRPPGEVNPEALIKQELIAHLKSYKRVREMVDRVLNDADRVLDVDDIAKYMDLLRKGIVDMSKPFIAAARPGEAKAEPEADGETILASLLEGMKRA